MLAAAALAGAAEDPAPERATFSKTTEEITLDGRLEETSWRAGTPVTKFFETYPADRGTPAEATTATFLYDDRNVYVAIRAFDHDPAHIRAPIVRRDLVLDDQDYVEVFLDPLNTRRSAFFFRVNARGIVTDGQYDDKNRLRDYAPDFDFDAAASIDEQGWTAEIRIPLSSLRYQAGIENRWAYVVYRNLPRQQQTATLTSAPIPRGENCDLCYASVLDGIAAERSGSVAVIPHIEYARLDDDLGASNEFDAGIDLTWKPRENTVVDATIFPDFSQIEADAPQLTANSQFALAVMEKRPFFLEGTDLLTTQLPVIYTRAFTDPDVGLRITDRSLRHEYTALALRDAGGGAVIEPGPLSSRLAVQDFESTAFVARDRLLLDDKSFGMLATARFNDDGSRNVVIGADGTWTPSAVDQISAQFLSSQTRNPSRPDLLDAWTGQRINGSAGSLSWAHSSNDWDADVTYQRYSRGFRAWNGFVTQVDIASLTGVVNRYFYPNNGSRIAQFGPQLNVARVDDGAGSRMNQLLAPGFTLRTTGDTLVSLIWYPGTRRRTAAGLRTYDLFRLSVTSTPFSWMPQATLTLTGGDVVDSVTGAVGHGFNVKGTIPLRWSRLEIASTAAYQTFLAARTGSDRLFTERSLRMTATWHFSNKMNLRLTQQETTFEAVAPFAGLEAKMRTSSRLSALLFDYQANWQTRYYVGASWSSNEGDPPISTTAQQTLVFAKISYAFSN